MSAGQALRRTTARLARLLPVACLLLGLGAGLAPQGAEATGYRRCGNWLTIPTLAPYHEAILIKVIELEYGDVFPTKLWVGDTLTNATAEVRGEPDSALILGLFLGKARNGEDALHFSVMDTRVRRSTLHLSTDTGKDVVADGGILMQTANMARLPDVSLGRAVNSCAAHEDWAKMRPLVHFAAEGTPVVRREGETVVLDFPHGEAGLTPDYDPTPPPSITETLGVDSPAADPAAAADPDAEERLLADLLPGDDGTVIILRRPDPSRPEGTLADMFGGDDDGEAGEAGRAGAGDGGGLSDLSDLARRDEPDAEPDADAPADPPAAPGPVDDAPMAAADDPPAPAGPIALRGRARACTLPGDRVLTIQAEDFDQPIALAAVLRSGGPLEAVLDYADGSDLEPAEDLFEIPAALGGKLAPVTLPFGMAPKRVVDRDEPVLALGAPGVAALVDGAVAGGGDPVAPTVAPVDEAPALMRLLVVGDADHVGISGLGRLERHLLTKTGADLWSVDWLEFDPQGDTTLHVGLGTLGKAVQEARRREGEFFADTEADVTKALAGMEKVLTEADAPYDHVIWVIKGQMLPHATPGLFEAFLRRINRDGQIGRFANGKPRDWIYVIAGSFSSEFSEFYLRAPIETLLVGAMTTQDTGPGKDASVLLNDVPGLSGILSYILSVKGADLEAGAPAAPPATPEVEGQPTLFDAPQVVQNLGLLIRADAVDRVYESIRATRAVLRALDKGHEMPIVTGMDDATRYAYPATQKDGALRLDALGQGQVRRRLRVLNQQFTFDQINSLLTDMDEMAEEYVIRSLSGCDFIYMPVHYFGLP